ncbi:bicarbonate transport ATP-binding protein CmpC [Halomonas elongata]|uniref:Bicarbonate transport ATP-binding protein CmpC n=1 Tax=Halomonas elongata TaxID=2746 RepID=A0A1B8NV17_HALEL|nr:bicarbonate transport ATP-binding protein CmpC [Halomonas elongata]
MSTPELERLTLGFIPLLDAALPIIAREAGFFADEGLEVALSRENAWSTLRDKVASGLLDGAHMLSPLPLAMSLGLSRAPCETLAPFILGRGGNTIVLSRRWSEDMDDIGEDRDPRDNARRFAARLHDHRGDPPRLAMVYPYSCQHYQLREWLASADIDIDRQVALGALPRPAWSRRWKAARSTASASASPGAAWPGIATSGVSSPAAPSYGRRIPRRFWA